jgi:hypothetical protein
MNDNSPTSNIVRFVDETANKALNCQRHGEWALCTITPMERAAPEVFRDVAASPGSQYFFRYWASGKVGVWEVQRRQRRTRVKALSRTIPCTKNNLVVYVSDSIQFERALF